MRGDKNGEVQVADQRRNQRGQYRQVPAKPGEHQPVAGGGGAMLLRVLGGFFAVYDLLALALLFDNHQHRHDEGDIGQCDQSIQRHTADGAGARGDVYRVEHDGKPGQRGGAPGQVGELGRSFVVNIQQPPRGALGHQQAGADGQEERRHKHALDPGVCHQIQPRCNGVDGAQAFDKDHARQTGQGRAHQQHPHSQTRAAQAAIGRALRRGKVAAQSAQPDAQRKHQHQRGQRAQQRNLPAVLRNGGVEAGFALANQAIDALQVKGDVSGKLLPQRGRQGRCDFARNLLVELLGADFFNAVDRLLGLNRQQLAAFDGRIQIAVLLQQILALLLDLWAFFHAIGRSA